MSLDKREINSLFTASIYLEYLAKSIDTEHLRSCIITIKELYDKEEQGRLERIKEHYHTQLETELNDLDNKQNS